MIGASDNLQAYLRPKTPFAEYRGRLFLLIE